MKKILIIFALLIYSVNPTFAWDFLQNFSLNNNDEKAIEKVLKSQVRYANKTNFNKFISTYDSDYVNDDGLNLETYAKLVQDVWETYDKIRYDIEIQNITINDDSAKVKLFETSHAIVPMPKELSGELKSQSNSIYYLKKTKGKWKVISDSVSDELTTMLYGNAKDLDIKLTVPDEINPNTEYSAILEFTPPYGTVAIASLTADKIEYPQKQAKEVFRALPDDNTLERIFTSNNENADEYVVASIGLTKTAIEDLSIKFSLTGFGYAIKRVNVTEEIKNNEQAK